MNATLSRGPNMNTLVRMDAVRIVKFYYSMRSIEGNAAIVWKSQRQETGPLADVSLPQPALL